MTPADRELYDRAVEAAANAYAPYSGFRVGAAARDRTGRVHVGVNVESASYPLGVCAERAALAAAITAGVVPGDVEALAVTARPCGACRQWLVELEVPVVLYGEPDGTIASAAPADLLPSAFDLAERLGRRRAGPPVS